MVTATITSKGQITIPKAVRDSLRLHSGDRVEFLVRGDGDAILKPIAKTVNEVFGMLHRPTGPKRTTEEMNRAIARKMGNRKR
ncbi:AbrB/MazE/SpoVT family DNA-binding domain-containing protein [Candidatus Sumerlaeota bacterium]|nr:AbrB/MazE/SpoVT family DNA-binding domain-containing protein [Candidatus Sumerlaeota bacterium]